MNFVVVPNSVQRFGLLPKPDSVAAGTSSCGDRMPPSALPKTSRATLPVESSWIFGLLGGTTHGVRIQIRRSRSAVWNTKWCGPAFGGRTHPSTPADAGPSMYRSACEVPAISQLAEVRGVRLAGRRRSGGCRSRPPSTITGVEMSVRMKVGFGIGVVDVELIGGAPADRLWIMYASYAWSRGLIALTYVVMRDADCDSPSAIR